MKALIIEDSRLARVELRSMLSTIDKITEVNEVASGTDAVQYLKEETPDVIFLDIHLPGLNGFEVLESLDFVPPVIFTTAFDEYAIKSFEFNAIDYLLKPIGKERLRQAIDKIPMEEKNVETIDQKKMGVDQQIFVRDGDKCWFVKMGDIRLFESVGNYTRIYFEQEKPLILKSLAYLENILEDKRFFRVNRQQMINVKFVKEIQPTFNGKLKITIVTGEEVEVSRRQSAEFKSLFSL